MDNFHRVLAQDLGGRVRKVLLGLNTIKPDTTIFIWPREERVVCLIDPLGVSNIEQLLSSRAHHHIQTACQGRRVVFTNHRCAAIQVAYFPEPVREIQTAALDWSQQPSAHHVPVGMTARESLWLSVIEMDTVLIGGARRMGKTRLIHSWIQALLRGKQAKLLLWDGKNGLEFARYAGQPQVTVAGDLREALAPLVAEVGERERLFRGRGVTSLAEYNAGAGAKLPILVPVIDEAAFIPDEAGKTIVELVARCGAFGVHPIFATQRPDADNLRGLLRANLSTRIALPVTSRIESQLILGQSGAEKLTKTPGRLLVAWRARLIEAQAFTFDLPAAEQLTPHASIAQLSDDERHLVAIAVRDCDGVFKIRDLTGKSGISKDAVLDLAARWELSGWLTPVQTNAKGHRIGRRVTPTLAEMAGVRSELGEFGN